MVNVNSINYFGEPYANLKELIIASYGFTNMEEFRIFLTKGVNVQTHCEGAINVFIGNSIGI